MGPRSVMMKVRPFSCFLVHFRCAPFVWMRWSCLIPAGVRMLGWSVTLPPYALVLAFLSAISLPFVPACPRTHITVHPTLFSVWSCASIHDLAGCVYSCSSLCIAPWLSRAMHEAPSSKASSTPAISASITTLRLPTMTCWAYHTSPRNLSTQEDRSAG